MHCVDGRVRRPSRVPGQIAPTGRLPQELFSSLITSVFRCEWRTMRGSRRLRPQLLLLIGLDGFQSLGVFVRLDQFHRTVGSVLKRLQDDIGPGRHENLAVGGPAAANGDPAFEARCLTAAMTVKRMSSCVTPESWSAMADMTQPRRIAATRRQTPDQSRRRRLHLRRGLATRGPRWD